MRPEIQLAEPGEVPNFPATALPARRMPVAGLMSLHALVSPLWIPSLLPMLAVAAARADPVALWLFDEPMASAPGAQLADAGPRGLSLVLDRGGEIGPGRFGQALRPRARGGARELVAVLPAPGDGATGRWSNPTDTKLNLGDDDWTVECWLRLEPASAAEGVLFEIGTGPRGENDLLTRISVLPSENAFALTDVAPGAPALDPGKRIEYPNPAGPPQHLAHVEVVTLALERDPLPRASWVHVALVHRAVAHDVHLFVGGKVRAVAAVRLAALPRGTDAYVSVGCDGGGGRKLLGRIDELRISDSAVYVAGFAPPGSFSPVQSGRRRDGRKSP